MFDSVVTQALTGVEESKGEIPLFEQANTPTETAALAFLDIYFKGNLQHPLLFHYCCLKNLICLYLKYLNI